MTLLARMRSVFLCWNARRYTLAWLRIRLTEKQQRVGNEERSVHRWIVGVRRRCRAPSWVPMAWQVGTMHV